MKKTLTILILSLSALFSQCGPPSSTESSRSTTGTTSSSSGIGSTPAVALPPTQNLLPATPATAPSSTGDKALECNPQGLAVQGHDYGQLTCSNMTANVSIEEVDASTVKIKSITLTGVPAPVEEMTNQIETQNRCVAIAGSGIFPTVWGYLMQRSIIRKIMPKATLKLLTSASNSIKELGFLEYERSTGSYVWTPPLSSSSNEYQYSKSTLHGANLEIFFGRHKCDYQYHSVCSGYDEAAKKALAQQACEQGGRDWNDQVFSLILKTQ